MLSPSCGPRGKCAVLIGLFKNNGAVLGVDFNFLSDHSGTGGI